MLGYTRESTNFFRFLTLLLDVGTQIYKEVFLSYYIGKTLQAYLAQPQEANIINYLRHQRTIKRDQYDLLYPQVGAPDINRFDISLLYTLIRNLSRNPNSPVWGTNPSGTDFSTEADIERIRHKRNNLVAHRSTASMSDGVFSPESAELQAVYLRLLQGLPAPTLTVDELKIRMQQILMASVDPDQERELLQELNVWMATDTLQEIQYVRGDMVDGFASLSEENMIEFAHLKDGLSTLTDQVENTDELTAKLKASREELEKFIENEHTFFTETEAFNHAKHQLETKNIVVMTGNPGTGKTYLSRFLAYQLLQIVKEAETFCCNAPKNFHDLRVENHPMIVLIDDFCGKHSLQTSELLNWMKLGEKLSTYLISKNIYLIFSVRKNILARIRTSLTSFDRLSEILAQESEVLLTSSDLTEDQKLQLVRKYTGHIPDISSNSQTFLEDLVGSDIPDSIGFPFLCRIAKSKARKGEIKRLFQTEFSTYLTEELQQLHDRDRTSYMLLVVSMCCNGQLVKHEESKEQRECIAHIAGVLNCDHPDTNEMSKKCEAMVGMFLKTEDGNTYQLVHHSVTEAVFANFKKQFPEQAIAISPVSMLSKLEAEDHDSLFSVQSKHFENVVRRFVQCSEVGDDHIMAQANIWDTENFREYFCQRLILNPADATAVANGNVLSTFAAVGHEPMVRVLSHILQIRYKHYFPNQIEQAICSASSHGQVSLIEYLLSLDVPPSPQACISAAEGGCVSIMEALIAKGCCPDIVMHNDENAIKTACKLGHIEMVEFLIRKYPHLLLTTYNGLSLIFLACWHGRDSVALFLAERYPSLLEVKTHNNATVIQAAAYGCKRETLQQLVELVSNKPENEDAQLLKEYLKGTCKTGDTSLHYAAAGGNVETFEYLLAKGLDVEQASENGQTVLHMACMFGRKKMVEYLIELLGTSTLSTPTLSGETCLHFAAIGGTDLLQYLLERGMSVSITTKNGETVLHKACANGKLSIMKFLDTKFLNLRDFETVNGETCMHYAAAGGCVEVFQHFVATGMNGYQTAKDGSSILHYACINGRLEMVKHIDSFFRDLRSSKTQHKASCLHYAAAGGNIDVFKYLIEKGVSVDQLASDHENVLHFACRHGRYDMVQYLDSSFEYLRKKKTLLGETCLHSAAAGGNLDVFQYLVSSGMDIFAETRSGHSILHTACTYRQYEVVLYLQASYPKLVSKYGLSCSRALSVCGDIDTLTFLRKVGIA